MLGKRLPSSLGESSNAEMGKIDVRKDLIIASSDELSVPAQALSYSVNWFGIPVAVIFIIVGVVAWIKRGGTIRRVKRESRSITK